AIFSVDTRYRYTTFNSFHKSLMKALYGVDIEIGKSILDYQTVPADREKAKQNLDRALNSERHADSAFSGDDSLSRHEFMVSHIPIRGNDGSVVGVAVYADKVIDREKVLHALEASRRRFETLFSAYNEGVALHELVYDEGGGAIDYRILDVNPAYEQMIGITKQNAVGRLASQLYGGSKAPYLDIYEAVARLGESTSFDSYFAPLDKYFSISVSTPSEGQFATVFMDITERIKAARALHESDDRYRQMLDHAGIGIGYWDPQGRLIMFNAMAARNMNGVPSDFVGKTMPELFGREAGQFYFERIKKAIVTEGPTEYEDMVDLPTGRRWFLTLHSKVLDSAGKVIGVQVFSHDISARKLAEEALRDSEEKYRILLHESSDPIFSFYRDGTYRYANKAFAAGVGMPPEALVGKNIRDVFPPVEAERSSVVLREVFTPCLPRHMEVRLPPADGDHYYLTSLTPVKNDAGTVITAICSSKDITGRKRMEDALRESRKHLAEAQKLGHFGSWTFDVRDGKINWTDEVFRIFGHDPAESAPDFATLINWYHPEDRQDLQDTVHAALTTGTAYEKDWRIVRPDGSVRYTHAQGQPISQDGTTIQIWGTIQDITEGRQTEEELRIRDKALATSIDAFAFADMDGRLTYVNPTFVRMWGFSSAEEVLGRPVSDFWVLANKAQEVVTALAEAGGWEGELTGRHYDESTFDVELSANLVRDESNRPLCMMASFRDITERKRAEARLRETKEYLQNLMDYANAPIIVWSPDFTITIFNHAFERLTGMSAEVVLGRHLEMLFPEETRTDSMKLIDAATSGDHWETVEIPIRGGRGDVRTVLWNSAVLRSESGAIIATIAQGQDITERKLAEEALLQSELRYRSVTENAKEAMVVAQDGLLKFVNPRALDMIQVKEDDAIGRAFIDFIHPEDRSMVAERYLRRLDGGDAPSRYDFRVLGHDGAVTWVSLSVVRISWEGKPATLNFLVDITERKRAEQELMQANRRLNLLSSITRHDALNQTLIVQGNADLLALKTLDAEQMAHVKTIKRSAENIQRQMEFAKLYQEIGAQTPTWASLRECVRKTKGSLALKGLKIDLSGPEYLIWADPMVEKVVYNMIDNCLRHSGGAKHLHITTIEHEGELKVAFEDDGVGVTPEDHRHLFERGYGKNTGFGLFLTREILGITGMAIVENGEPGKGARFEITVPAGNWRLGRSDMVEQ
ncbi:MAG: PAS domain S-box protein, partial [Methanomassiliicoccales archaeon]